MEFELDENKSRANREKHGIDFVEAQMLQQQFALQLKKAEVLLELERRELEKQMAEEEKQLEDNPG